MCFSTSGLYIIDLLKNQESFHDTKYWEQQIDVQHNFNFPFLKYIKLKPRSVHSKPTSFHNLKIVNEYQLYCCTVKGPTEITATHVCLSRFLLSAVSHTHLDFWLVHQASECFFSHHRKEENGILVMSESLLRGKTDYSMAEWQQVPASSRNREPRSVSANRTEKTGRHRDINSPGKNGKLQVSKRKLGTQRRPELWRWKEYLSTTNSQL